VFAATAHRRATRMNTGLQGGHTVFTALFQSAKSRVQQREKICCAAKNRNIFLEKCKKTIDVRSFVH
jgi:hypothetical protein